MTVKTVIESQGETCSSYHEKRSIEKASYLSGVYEKCGVCIEFIVEDTMESFRIKTTVSVSPTFFGWVFGFVGKVQILGPESVKEQYKQMIINAKNNLIQGR